MDLELLKLRRWGCQLETDWRLVVQELELLSVHTFELSDP